VTRHRGGLPLAVALIALTHVALTACTAQRAATVARPSRWRPGVRADAIVDRDPGAQIAAGVAVATAYNVRLSVDVGAGGVQRPAGVTATGRVDLLGRLVLDPYRQSRWGITAGGGIGQQFESGRAPRTVAIVTLGVEGPSDGRWVRGVEVGLGGGIRAGVTLRRAPLRQR
jgi:hypothetical protein